MDSGENNNSKFEGTVVDLGEDLLEKTRVTSGEGLMRPTAQPEPVANSNSKSEPVTPEDELQRGEILMGERLFDDAKKIFRKLFRRDRNAKAQKHLEEIQRLELQDLLGGEASRKRISDLTDERPESPEEVAARLEKDLGITIGKPNENVVPSLFAGSMSLTRYSDDILKTVTKLSPRERLDVGIAYLEMGLGEVARSIFESVVRYEEHKLTGLYLLGLALIQSGKAIEATIRLEPVVRDMTLTDAEKTDFLYLMGSAFEALGDVTKARGFFRRVYLLNPRYRDVVDKLR